MKLAISSALLLAVAACGGDDGGVTLIDGGDIDATSGPDACVAAKPSAPQAVKNGRAARLHVQGPVVLAGGTCQATADYGAVPAGGTQIAGAEFPECETTNPDLVYVGAALNTDASPDVLELDLYKGYGAFATGEIRTGTFQISGDETSFADCGVCGLLLADLDTQGNPGSVYLAQSGTVTLTSVSPNVTGSVSNLTFIHVDIAGGESTPNPDNCASAITSLAFDATIE